MVALRLLILFANVLVLNLFFYASISWGNSFLSFPDPNAFVGIARVSVAPVNLQNMESVKLKSEALRASIVNQLKAGKIQVVDEKKFLHQNDVQGKKGKDLGVLEAGIYRSESSRQLGFSLNSFLVSLQFFQRATVEASQQEAWVVTWGRNNNVITGLKRPGEIEKTLEELVRAFIQEFKE